MLETVAPKVLETIDYRLYANSCAWRLNKALEITRVAAGESDIEQLKFDLAASCNRIPPPFEEWKAEHLRREYTEKSLVWGLQQAGLQVPAAVKPTSLDSIMSF